MYLSETHCIEQNIPPISTTSRVGADCSSSRYTSSVVTNYDTETLHRYAIKGVDYALSYDRHSMLKSEVVKGKKIISEMRR